VWALLTALSLESVEEGWLLVFLGIGVVLVAAWYVLVTPPALAGVALGRLLAEGSPRRDREYWDP